MGNSNGTLAEYWDAIESTPGLQGGYIWEWWDHGLEQQLPDGTTRWAYGGDFGDTPNDGDFCVDGLNWPDRRPKPAMWEHHAIASPGARRPRWRGAHPGRHPGPREPALVPGQLLAACPLVAGAGRRDRHARVSCRCRPWPQGRPESCACPEGVIPAEAPDRRVMADGLVRDRGATSPGRPPATRSAGPRSDCPARGRPSPVSWRRTPSKLDADGRLRPPAAVGRARPGTVPGAHGQRPHRRHGRGMGPAGPGVARNDAWWASTGHSTVSWSHAEVRTGSGRDGATRDHLHDAARWCHPGGGGGRDPRGARRPATRRHGPGDGARPRSCDLVRCRAPRDVSRPRAGAHRPVLVDRGRPGRAVHLAPGERRPRRDALAGADGRGRRRACGSRSTCPDRSRCCRIAPPTWRRPTTRSSCGPGSPRWSTSMPRIAGSAPRAAAPTRCPGYLLRPGTYRWSWTLEPIGDTAQVKPKARRRR